MEKLERVLQEVRHLKKPEIEKTIFSIGGRGHYENPISDILAFFLDPKEQHGFGNLFLESLFQSANKEVRSIHLADSPKREQPTKSGNRIDLIVEGDDWVVVIENKIHHTVNNPFDDYEQYTRQNYNGKKPIFMLLSIEKLTHENWIPVTYVNFINQIKANIGNHLFSVNNNKWHVILREFILNIENEYRGTMYNKDRIDFAKKYYSEIKELNTILKDYLEYLGQTCKEAVNRASSNQDVASVSSPKGSSGDTVFAANPAIA